MSGERKVASTSRREGGLVLILRLLSVTGAIVLLAHGVAPVRAQDAGEALDAGLTDFSIQGGDTAIGRIAHDGGAADGGTTSPAGGGSGAQVSRLTPLAHAISPWWGLLIGALGSLAYLLAAYTGFIGVDAAARSRILEHFDGHVLIALGKVVLFGCVGGGVAMVFQLTEHFLVPIQAFILGCTWPAVVGNYLSSRQQGEDASFDERVARVMRRAEESTDVLGTLPQGPAVAAQDARQELDELVGRIDEEE